MKRLSPDVFGQRNYRDGAFQRMGEAAILLRAQKFSGSIYLAGRAVEGMLRAVIWKYDPEIQRGNKALETGHDVRELLIVIRKLGLLRSHPEPTNLEGHVQRVGRLWYNNMRFAASRYVEIRWQRLGEVHKRRTFKQAAHDFFDACSIIVRQCEVLCEK